MGSITTIVAAAGAVWLVLSVALAVVLGRMMRGADVAGARNERFRVFGESVDVRAVISTGTMRERVSA